MDFDLIESKGCLTDEKETAQTRHEESCKKEMRARGWIWGSLTDRQPKEINGVLWLRPYVHRRSKRTN